MNISRAQTSNGTGLQSGSTDKNITAKRVFGAENPRLREYFEFIDPKTIKAIYMSEADLNGAIVSDLERYISTQKAMVPGIGSVQGLINRVNRITGSNHATLLDLLKSVKTGSRADENFAAAIRRLLIRPGTASEPNLTARSVSELESAIKSNDGPAVVTAVDKIGNRIVEIRKKIEPENHISENDTRQFVSDMTAAVEAVEKVGLDEDTTAPVARVYAEADGASTVLISKADEKAVYLVCTFRQKLRLAVDRFLKAAQNIGLLNCLSDDFLRRLRDMASAFEMQRRRELQRVREIELEKNKKSIMVYVNSKQETSYEDRPEKTNKGSAAEEIMIRQLNKRREREIEDLESEEKKAENEKWLLALFLKRLTAARGWPVINAEFPAAYASFGKNEIRSFLLG